MGGMGRGRGRVRVKAGVTSWPHRISLKPLTVWPCSLKDDPDGAVLRETSSAALAFFAASACACSDSMVRSPFSVGGVTSSNHPARSQSKLYGSTAPRPQASPPENCCFAAVLNSSMAVRSCPSFSPAKPNAGCALIMSSTVVDPVRPPGETTKSHCLADRSQRAGVL